MHKNKGKSIRQSLKNRLAYILNEKKTEGKYISSYGCNPEIADQEFAETKRAYGQFTGRTSKGDIIAYQIRQSFLPGEITPDEANQIGYETALRFTKGNHAFVVATHTDKAHIHNHVVFNSTALTEDRKFRDFWFVALALQRLSDLICLENRLSVIQPRKPGEREKRTGYPKRESYRKKLCQDIEDVFTSSPSTLDEFLDQMRGKGYEVKRGKHLAFRGKGQKRFFRLRSLEEEYHQEKIINRIEAGRRNSQKQVKTKKEFDLLINIQEKLKQGKGEGYSRWASVYNIKQMAHTLLFLQEKEIRSMEVLREKAEDSSKKFHELSLSIKELEKQLAEISELKKQIINYLKTKEVYAMYRKSGYSKRFLEDHKEEIMLHKAAKKAFNDFQGKKLLTIKELNQEFESVLLQKRKTYAKYQQVKKEMQEYVTAKHNIEVFLKNEEKEQKEKTKNQVR